MCSETCGKSAEQIFRKNKNKNETMMQKKELI